MSGRGMNVDISKWEIIAHVSDRDSLSKRTDFFCEKTSASGFTCLRRDGDPVAIRVPKQPSPK